MGGVVYVMKRKHLELKHGWYGLELRGWSGEVVGTGGWQRRWLAQEGDTDEPSPTKKSKLEFAVLELDKALALT